MGRGHLLVAPITTTFPLSRNPSIRARRVVTTLAYICGARGTSRRFRPHQREGGREGWEGRSALSESHLIAASFPPAAARHQSVKLIKEDYGGRLEKT